MLASLDLSKALGRVRIQDGLDLDELFRIPPVLNLVTYQGGDIVAALLAGNQEYRIAGMWLEFQNGGTVAGQVAHRADTAASVLAGLASNQDILRLRLAAQPVLATTDSNHTANSSTFVVMSDGGTGAHRGLQFSAAAGSQVYGASLIAAPVWGDVTKDLIYARVIRAPLATVTGAVSAAWTAQAL